MPIASPASSPSSPSSATIGSRDLFHSIMPGRSREPHKKSRGDVGQSYLKVIKAAFIRKDPQTEAACFLRKRWTLLVELGFEPRRCPLVGTTVCRAADTAVHVDCAFAHPTEK